MLCKTHGGAARFRIQLLITAPPSSRPHFYWNGQVFPSNFLCFKKQSIHLELKNVYGYSGTHGRDTSERSHRGNNDEDESIENKMEDPTLFSPKKNQKMQKEGFN